MTLAIDHNKNILSIREGDAVGGYYERAAADVVQGTWYRLMPHGNDAIPRNDRELIIGALRSDVLNIKEWNIEILNVGYYQKHKIREYANTVATLDKPLNYFEGLPDTLEYVIYPSLLIPLGIHFQPSDDDENMDIGFAVETELYTPSIKKYISMKPNNLLMMHTHQIQKIWYRYPSITASRTYDISWGEHYLA